MSPGARAAVVALAAAALAGAPPPPHVAEPPRPHVAEPPRPRAAEPTVSLEGPPPSPDSLRDLTPTFVLRAAGFDPADVPRSLTLQIATDAGFTSLVVDTTVQGDSASITLVRPLPERTTVYWRARARAPGGTEALSVTEARIVGAWLTLLEPNGPNGTTVFTRRPRFVWSSAHVNDPPGPWRYEISILNVATRQPIVIGGLTDTVYVPPFDLESNTSYRWSVTARLAAGASADTTRAASLATFVILDENAPPATLLYQNFPNPFPSATSTSTCIWFDLASPAIVLLDIRDIRGNFVRQIIPSAANGGSLPAGRYGRPRSTGGGCDPAYTWDGTAEDGSVVPQGVYLVRLRANGYQAVKKALFRGR